MKILQFFPKSITFILIAWGIFLTNSESAKALSLVKDVNNNVTQILDLQVDVEDNGTLVSLDATFHPGQSFNDLFGPVRPVPLREPFFFGNQQGAINAAQAIIDALGTTERLGTINFNDIDAFIVPYNLGVLQDVFRAREANGDLLIDRVITEGSENSREDSFIDRYYVTFEGSAPAVPEASTVLGGIFTLGFGLFLKKKMVSSKV